MATTDMSALAAQVLRAAVDKAVSENQPMGHEDLAAVVLPQVAESDRAFLEISLFAAFKYGLFKDVSPDAFREIPQEQLALAVTGGRALFLAMERVQKSRNPFGVDFRLDEARAVVAWFKIAETRVPARNRLVAYARLGEMMNRGGALSNDEPKATYRNEEQQLVEDIEPAPEPQRRTSNLNDSEIARRRAALAAAQKASRS